MADARRLVQGPARHGRGDLSFSDGRLARPVPPYGAPDGYPQPQQTSPLAIVSLVTGILGVLCCNFFVLSIAAVVTGVIGRKQIAQSGGRQKGDGLAKAGLVLGIVGLVLGVVLFVLNIVFGWNSGEINVG